MHLAENEIGVTGSLHGHCAVFGCHRGARGLKKWLTSECLVHAGYTHNVGSCICAPPYVLWTFPQDQANRKKWVQKINRKDWQPTRYIVYQYVLAIISCEII